MSAPTVLGIDPGGQTIGWVIRRGLTLLDHGLIERPEGLATYEWAISAGQRLNLAAYVPHAPELRRAESIIAIEDVIPPNPHAGMMRPGDLIAVSMVAGALFARFPDAVIVRPGKHGSHPLGTYPPVLVGAGERKGTGKLRHARSAWDIAAAGVFAHQTESRSA